MNLAHKGKGERSYFAIAKLSAGVALLLMLIWHSSLFFYLLWVKKRKK